MDDLLQQVIIGVALGALYAPIACGISLIYRETGSLCFGYVALPAIGGIIAMATVAILKHTAPGLSSMLVALAAFAVAALGCAGVARWLARCVWQPLLRAHPVVAVVGSLASAAAILNLLAFLWQGERLTFPALLSDESSTWMGAQVLPSHVVVIGGTALLLILVAMISPPATNMRHGTAPTTASSSVPAAYAIAGVLSAAAGVAHGLHYNVLPLNWEAFPLIALIAACIGGLGSLAGAIWGSLLMGIVISIGAASLGTLSDGFLDSAQHEAIPVLLLTVFFLLRAGVVSNFSRSPEPSLPMPAGGPDMSDGTRYAVLATLAALPLLATWLEESMLLYGLMTAMPMIAITIGMGCAISQARVADLGYMMYPMIGAYTYALIASDQVAPLVNQQMGQSQAAMSEMAALALGALAASVLAALMHMIAGRLPRYAMALLTISMYGAVATSIVALSDPFNLTTELEGVESMPDLSLADTAMWQQLSGYYLGLLVVAGAAALAARPTVAPLGRVDDSDLSWYIMSAAIGGLGGALLAAAHGVVSPATFSAGNWLTAAAIIMLAGARPARLMLNAAVTHILYQWWTAAQSGQAISDSDSLGQPFALWSLICAVVVVYCALPGQGNIFSARRRSRRRGKLSPILRT